MAAQNRQTLPLCLFREPNRNYSRHPGNTSSSSLEHYLRLDEAIADFSEDLAVIYVKSFEFRETNQEIYRRNFCTTLPLSNILRSCLTGQVVHENDQLSFGLEHPCQNRRPSSFCPLQGKMVGLHGFGTTPMFHPCILPASLLLSSFPHPTSSTST